MLCLDITKNIFEKDMLKLTDFLARGSSLSTRFDFFFEASNVDEEVGSLDEEDEVEGLEDEDDEVEGLEDEDDEVEGREDEDDEVEGLGDEDLDTFEAAAVE